MNSNTSIQTESIYSQIIRILQNTDQHRNQEEYNHLVMLASKIPFFQKYVQNNQEYVIRRCCKYFHLQEFKAGEIVFEINQPAEYFYLLLQGEVGLYMKNDNQSHKSYVYFEEQSDREGNEQNQDQQVNFTNKSIAEKIFNTNNKNHSIAQIKVKSIIDSQDQCQQQFKIPNLVFLKKLYPGEGFGELALINFSVHSATIRCLGHCYTAKLTKQQFSSVMQQVEEDKIIKEMNFLFNIPAFNSWNANELMQLYISSFRINYYQRDIVFSEGQISNSFYIIISGEFIVKKCIQTKEQPLTIETMIQKEEHNQRSLKIKRTQKEFQLSLLSTNDFFGEDDLLNQNAKRSYTVQCVSRRGQLMMVMQTDFNNKIMQNKNTAIYLKSIVAQKKKINEEKIVQIQEQMSQYENFWMQTQQQQQTKQKNSKVNFNQKQQKQQDPQLIEIPKPKTNVLISNNRVQKTKSDANISPQVSMILEQSQNQKQNEVELSLHNNIEVDPLLMDKLFLLKKKVLSNNSISSPKKKRSNNANQLLTKSNDQNNNSPQKTSNQQQKIQNQNQSQMLGNYLVAQIEGKGEESPCTRFARRYLIKNELDQRKPILRVNSVENFQQAMENYEQNENEMLENNNNNKDNISNEQTLKRSSLQSQSQKDLLNGIASYCKEQNLFRNFTSQAKNCLFSSMHSLSSKQNIENDDPHSQQNISNSNKDASTQLKLNLKKNKKLEKYQELLKKNKLIKHQYDVQTENFYNNLKFKFFQKFKRDKVQQLKQHIPLDLIQQMPELKYPQSQNISKKQRQNNDNEGSSSARQKTTQNQSYNSDGESQQIKQGIRKTQSQEPQRNSNLQPQIVLKDKIHNQFFIKQSYTKSKNGQVQNLLRFITKYKTMVTQQTMSTVTTARNNSLIFNDDQQQQLQNENFAYTDYNFRTQQKIQLTQTQAHVPNIQQNVGLDHSRQMHNQRNLSNMSVQEQINLQQAKRWLSNNQRNQFIVNPSQSSQLIENYLASTATEHIKDKDKFINTSNNSQQVKQYTQQKAKIFLNNRGMFPQRVRTSYTKLNTGSFQLSSEKINSFNQQIDLIIQKRNNKRR